MKLPKYLLSYADIDLNQLIKLNHEIDPNNLGADQTILVPVGKLSERDRLILDGMGKGKYRTYPMRKGEKLSDVLSKRNITLKEFEDLNPGVNPDKIPGAMPVCMLCIIHLYTPISNVHAKQCVHDMVWMVNMHHCMLSQRMSYQFNPHTLRDTVSPTTGSPDTTTSPVSCR